MRYYEYLFSITKNIEDDLIETFFDHNFKDYFIDEDIKNNITTLKMYLSAENTNEDFINYLMEKFHLELLSKELVIEKDWLKAWLDTLKPFKLIEGIWINPFPEKSFEKENAQVLHIIPGSAFGTGLHPTTKLASKMLKNINLNGKSVLDIGCGTGILSMVAKLLGAGEVKGYDYDKIAIEKAKDTIKLNKMDIETGVSDFLDNVDEYKPDILISNMVAELLINLMNHEKFDKFIEEKTEIIFSGIIYDKENLIMNKAKEKGLELKEKMEGNTWIALRFQKKI
ncbi:MAG: 50S ribosomal protein L11 methyltransferase [Thermotogota bacterium]